MSISILNQRNPFPPTLILGLALILLALTLAGCNQTKPAPQAPTYIDRPILIEKQVPVYCEAKPCPAPIKLEYKDPKLSYTQRAFNLSFNIRASEAYIKCLTDNLKLCTKPIDNNITK